MHVCVCTCMCMSLWFGLCLNIYVYTYLHWFNYMHVSVYVYVHAYVYACIYIHERGRNMYMYTCSCSYVCMYLHVYITTCQHTSITMCEKSNTIPPFPIPSLPSSLFSYRPIFIYRVRSPSMLCTMVRRRTTASSHRLYQQPPAVPATGCTSHRNAVPATEQRRGRSSRPKVLLPRLDEDVAR